MKGLVLVAAMAGLILGCKNGPGAAPGEVQGPNEAIRSAIEAHLAHRGTLNLKAFDTELKQVTIQGNHATAQAEFRVKGGPGVMQLTYALEQRDGAWSVVESDPVGSNFSHPALDQGSSAPAMGTAGSSHSLADTLRSFQISPPSTQTLPPGHPPITGPNGPVAPPAR